MTDITVDPCEEGPINTDNQEGGGGGDNTNDNTNENTNDPVIVPIVLDRVSFPERIVDQPLAQSERLVTIMNSVHFFENNLIYFPQTSLAPGQEPQVRPIQSDASTIFEISRERLEEAGFRPNVGTTIISSRAESTVSRAEKGFGVAKSKGLVDPSLDFYDYYSAELQAAEDRGNDEAYQILAAAKEASRNLRLDPIRYSSGLVFTNSRDKGSLIIANSNQFVESAAEEAAAENNFLNFGCPYYLTKPTEQTIVDQTYDGGVEFLYFFGISRVIAEKRKAKFFLSVIQRNAPSTLNLFKGFDDLKQLRNFSDIYMYGAHRYRDEGTLSTKTDLRLTQLENLVPTPLSYGSSNSGFQPYNDITFEAPQAFFKEEADHIALGKQMIADVNVYVGSTELNDGSVVKDFSEFTSDELQKKNFYRNYSGRTLTKSQIDAKQQGKVVKFSSRNVDQFKNINEEQKNLFSKHVNIVIENQKAQLTGVSSILKKFDMEKYIIEMMSDTNGLRTADELSVESTERIAMFLDQHYDAKTKATEIESYYSQYLQEGESIEDVRLRMNSVLDNFNQDSFKRNIFQTVWSSFGDNLSMIKLKLLPGHPLRQELMEDVRDLPGLYGSENGVVNPLEWPLGFHESLPDVLEMSEQDNRPSDAWRFDELKYAICSAKLKEYLEPKGFRSYQDILEGKKSYSEVIGYKIKKFIIDQEAAKVSSSPVQEFYIMGNGTDNVINFVDSQVIFEKKYKYEITSINFVVGSIYYLNWDKEGQSTQLTGTRNLKYTSYDLSAFAGPAWSIVEAPLFSRIVHVVDKPPLSPQVSFLPYMGHDNKIKLLLQSNFGRIKQKPIKILESDEQVISQMTQAQEIDLASGKLEYANDSLPTQFQMIRIDHPPTKYTDFAESNKVVTIDAIGRAATVDDEIQPNKDYYYIFRAIDQRGVSNPGFVYKMRMVSYENGIYMDLKEHDMSRKKDQITIPFRKFLQIEPNNLNKTFNFGNIDVTSPEFAKSVPDSVSLGNDPDNVIWNKKFKIRIKSKNSGRKIDLIVKFKQGTREINIGSLLSGIIGTSASDLLEPSTLQPGSDIIPNLGSIVPTGYDPS